MVQPQLSSWLPTFLQNSRHITVGAGVETTDTTNTIQLIPNVGQILRSKRARIVAAALFVIVATTVFVHGSEIRFKFDGPYSSHPTNPACAENNVDWSRFAYTQYVTDVEYLCNSVMLFEILHRLGSKADRLMMYPANMSPDPASGRIESRLLLKAQNEYNVKLLPIEIQHRSGGDGKSPQFRISMLSLTDSR